MLQQLNEVQRHAVTYEGGSLLVIAGAGSGKTRVLTYRIGYLLAERNVLPHEILAVTFTNKAAKEMRERVEELVGPKAGQLWMGTFHSICVQILRRYADRIGYTSQFSIFDTTDQLAVVRQCLKELNIDAKKFDPRAILSAISQAKNERLSVEEYTDNATDLWERRVAQVYAAYNKELYQANAFDFDDLLLKTLALFEQEPSILGAYQDRFRHILVDEYQDTNHVQYLLIKHLAAVHRNICVVGDADQSIYKFRGADIRNILDFERDYPDVNVVKLEQNYRSTKRILSAANAVIEQNMDRLDKQLYTENEEGSKIGVYRGYNADDEATFLCDEVARLQREEGMNNSDVAVLYRTHAQSRVLEEKFMRRGINYQIHSGLRFYERKEIKDILAYLRAIANPADALSMRRVINVPKRGIGATTVDRLDAYAAAQNITLYEAIAQADGIDTLGTAARGRVQSFCELINSCMAQSEDVGITALTEFILQETGYLDNIRAERTHEAEAREENINEFLSMTQQFEKENEEATLFEFLEHVALISDADTVEDDETGPNAITLMTLHSAKGLEFPVVFLVGMEEDLFPHSRANWDEGELEEERRLCYVGMTRAQKHLYMTYAAERFMYGQTRYTQPSRFLAEIPEDLIEDLTPQTVMQTSVAGQPKAGFGNRRPTLAQQAVEADTAPEETFAAGERVEHPTFGIGTVVQTEKAGAGTVLTIAFPNEGVKKIMAGIVPLKKV